MREHWMSDDEEDEHLEGALDVVAKRIKKECSEIAYQRHTLDEDSLPSLLIGSIIPSGLTKTPLHISIGVYFHKKKTITHMHDYLVSCSYDELKRFKMSSAKAKYTQLCKKCKQPTTVNGLVQIIVDNFDASLSSPNGLVSTHDMATIDTNYTPPTEEGPGTIPRISKTSAMRRKMRSFHTSDHRSRLPQICPRPIYRMRTSRLSGYHMRGLTTWIISSSRFVYIF